MPTNPAKYDPQPHGAIEDSPAGQAAGSGARKYGLGFVIALVMTIGSFWVASTGLVWPPAVPVLLAALAIGQMGVHLVFFLHISSAPDSLNTILALAFGVFVVGLVVFGSLIIMWNLNANMMPM